MTIRLTHLSRTLVYFVSSLTFLALAGNANASDLFVLNRAPAGSVLRYDSATGEFLGNFVSPGAGGLSFPNDLTFGPDGNLYVSQQPAAPFTSSMVLRYNGTTGAFIDVFVAPGIVSGANTIRFGPDGNLYVADFSPDQPSSGSVKRFNGISGAFIDTFTSGYGMAHPAGMAFGPDLNLYVSDELNIVQFNGATGNFMSVFVSGTSDGLSVPPCGPAGEVEFGPDLNLYATANYCATIPRYNGVTGAFKDFFVASGTAGLNSPNWFKFGPNGNLFVSDPGTTQVFLFDGSTGAFKSVFVPTGSGGLSGAGGLIFGPDHVCLLYDAAKAVHSGSTIPIKIELCDANGTNLSSSNTLIHAVSISSVSTAISGDVLNAGNSNPDNNFRFDSTLASGGGYIFNLKTTGLTTGTYHLNFYSGNDLLLYAVPFQVK